MTGAIRALILLGVVAQLWTFYTFQHDILAMLGGGPYSPGASDLLLFLLPTVLTALGVGGGALLHRRGSVLAGPVVWVPLVLLVVGLALALYLTLFPLRLHWQ